MAKRVAVMQVLVVRLLVLAKRAQVLVVRFLCLGKTRGGDAGACGKVIVLAKRVAVMQVLVVRLLVLAKRVAVTQVHVVRFLSWQNAWR